MIIMMTRDTRHKSRADISHCVVACYIKCVWEKYARRVNEEDEQLLEQIFTFILYSFFHSLSTLCHPHITDMDGWIK